MEAPRALSRKGLVSISPEGVGTFYYSPKTAELSAIASSLVEIYDTRRFDVVRTMTTHPFERMRAAAAHALLTRPKEGFRRGMETLWRDAQRT